MGTGGGNGGLRWNLMRQRMRTNSILVLGGIDFDDKGDLTVQS
jgi:hypothetical protein